MARANHIGSGFEPTGMDGAKEEADLSLNQACWPGPAPPVKTAPAERVVQLILRTAPESAGAGLTPLSANEQEAGAMRKSAPLRWPRLRANVDPAIVCALLLLHRLIRETLRRTPDLPDRQIIVLEVLAEAWVRPVCEAWQTLMANGQRPTHPEHLGVNWDASRSAVRPAWMLFQHMGHDDVVTWAAVNGIPVLGVSAAPDRLLPAGLARGADLRLRLPRLDLPLLQRAARILTGTRGDETIGHDCVRGVLPETVRLARRPGQTGDDWLKRIGNLLQMVQQSGRGITLGDLSGMDDVVAWGTDLARDVALYEAGSLPWASVDRGALLVGPPGVGKTTAAAAIARSCAVPLISTSYSAWQANREGHLGHVIQALRDVFARARAMAPVIVFIDEVDSIRGRTAGSYRDDWWGAITNALLEELDGLASREGVVIVAATNHPEMLDPALVRAGRLDRVLLVPLPNAAALCGILRFHLQSDLAGTDLTTVAERLETRGATGADVERAVRDARRRARDVGRPVTLDDLLAETAAGPPISPEERWLVAVHEAAHATVAHVVAPNSVVHVSAKERGGAGGWTTLQRIPERMTRASVLNTITVLLGGRAAEEALLGFPSAGAGGGPSSDLARASQLATQAITSWGLGRGAGALRWHENPRDRTPAVRPSIPAELDRQISELLRTGYAEALRLLRTHRSALKNFAEHLLAVGAMDGAEVHQFLDGQGVQVRPALNRRHSTRGSTGCVRGPASRT